jgi:hypothetical protein
MPERGAWLALQRHLVAARVAVERGDRERALAEVAAALAIDPDFLAAHTLRGRLLSEAAPPDASPSPRPADIAPPAAGASRGVSAESYARFQQRAKARRVETRVEAARDAIQHRRLTDADAALDEIRELDPQHEALGRLAADADGLRRRIGTSRRGPWLTAAATFVATILGASYLQESSSLVSRPVMNAGILLPAMAPAPMGSTRGDAVGTAGDIASVAAPSFVAMPRNAEPAAPDVVNASLAPAAVSSAAPQPVAALVDVPVAPRVEIPVEPVPLSLPAPPLAPPVVEAVVAPAAPPPSPPPLARPDPVVDDSMLVQRTLQSYRRAYEDLDAQSAQTVWPAVNAPALARAFDGLQSQSLTFDACDVRVVGDAATATCRGTASYVTKVGSRDPRVEPRVWSFVLHKSAGNWTIDSARTDR